MQRWSSQPIPVPAVDDAPWERADLEFEGVEHDGPSYAVAVFLNNPDVADDAGDHTSGFAGRFTVFAHGDCWGDAGHCEPTGEPVSALEPRRVHPQNTTENTDQTTHPLQALGAVDDVTVTALAWSSEPDKREDVLRFARLTLITYDPPATL